MKNRLRRRSIVSLLAAASLLFPVVASAAPGDSSGEARDMLTQDVVVPGSEGTVIGFSTESDPWPPDTPGAVDGTAQAVLTDDPSEIWLVRYEGGRPVSDPPHWLAFDSGAERTLTGIQYQMKYNNGAGHAKDIKVYVTSDDAVVDSPEDADLWGEPVYSAALPMQPDTLQHLRFDSPVDGRFIKFEALSSHDPQSFVGASFLRAVEQVEVEAPEFEPLPEVIPSITGPWVGEEGTFVLRAGARIVAAEPLRETAEVLAAELGSYLDAEVAVVDGPAQAGDVVLQTGGDPSVLGDEGYNLDIAETVTITSATEAGVFFGTRTLAQLFVQQLELPYGAANDVPVYRERGLTLSASNTVLSEEWLDRIIEEMSYFKLNYILFELKMPSSSFPETATWGYYTPDQVRTLVAKANARGITVIPEINSPGHMEIWLENRDDLQLKDVNGNGDEMRLDITTPEAFEFYTTLIDEYMEVFGGSPYWHMGADEYMIYAQYERFPQVLAYAREKFGAGASPEDAYIDFVNRVNEYVRDTHGKTLRIWNDGLTKGNRVAVLSPDIVVEHWLAGNTKPSELLAAGHQVMNSSVELYITRGGGVVDADWMYRTGWHVGKFHGEALGRSVEGVTGAKVSLWPDNSAAITENQVEEQVKMPMRVLAQMTWADEHRLGTYGEFLALADTLGRPYGWANVDRFPFEEGSYDFTLDGKSLTIADDGTLVVSEESRSAWKIAKTADSYYVIKSQDGSLCLDVVKGRKRLGVPLESNVPVEAVACSGSNIQKWQIRSTETGVDVVNASTQQHMTIDDSGNVVQREPDRTSDQWALEAQADVTLEHPSRVEPGSQFPVTVTVHNPTDVALTDVSSTLSMPTGWVVAQPSVSFGDVAPGGTESQEILAVAAAAPLGSGSGSLTTNWTVEGGNDHSVVSSLGFVVGESEARVPVECSASSSNISPGTENHGGPERACDGDASSIWHTKWEGGTDSPPYTFTMDLGEDASVFGLNYLPRQDKDRGHIKDYQVHVSSDGENWSEPVAAGTMPVGFGWVQLEFEPSEARYVRLTALNERNGNSFVAAAEFTVEAYGGALPHFTPAITADGEAAAGQALSVNGSGFVPQETVDLTLTRDEVVVGEPVEATADEEGVVATSLPVPADAEPGDYVIVALGRASGIPATATTKVTSQEPIDPFQGTLSLNATKVKPGAKVLVSGSQWPADAEVKLELHSAIRELGNAVVGADGSFAVEVTIPADTAVGKHQLKALLGENEVSVELEVVKDSAVDPGGDGKDKTPSTGDKPGGLANTGATVGIIAAVAAVLLGAGALMRLRLRR